MSMTVMSHEVSKVQTLVIHLSCEGSKGQLKNDLVVIPTLNGKNFDT